MKSDDYRFEKLSQENLKDLLPIYSDAYGKAVALEYLYKKQNTDFAGISFIGYLAYDKNNSPAAFYGVYACLAEYKNKKYLAAQSGDTMTHSNHTGKGLFTILAEKTYELCQQLGVHFVFGFPNKNSYPGFVKKLNWIHFDDLQSYHIRVKCLPWVRVKQLFKLPQSLHQVWGEFVLSLLPKGSYFASSCKTDQNPVVDHSSQFYNYKTYGYNKLIKIAGINLWVKFDEVFLLIGDIERCEEADFLKMTKRLKTVAFLMGLPHLRFTGSSNTWGINMFKKYGQKLDNTYPAGGVNFTGIVPLEKMKFTMADNDTF